jgi:hypothetical protein
MPIPAEHSFHFFIARQVPPGSTRSDQVPFCVADVFLGTALLNLINKPCKPFLILGWSGW